MREEEVPCLADFLYDAIYQPVGADFLPRDVVWRPELAAYIEEFGRPGDFCLTPEAGGYLLGAVWTRIFTGEQKGYGTVDAFTPELAASVKKEVRRQGIGGRLIKAMLTLLKGQGYEKVSLSVHPENEAIRLYERLGFQTDLIQDGDCRMVKWL